MTEALNPQAKQVLDLMAASGEPTMDQMSPADARVAFSAGLTMLQSTPPEVAEVRDLSVPGPAGEIPGRAYRPDGAAADAVLPVCMYFHGGGFVVGDLERHETLCRGLANAARCAVVAVDYRPAPGQRAGLWARSAA